MCMCQIPHLAMVNLQCEGITVRRGTEDRIRSERERRAQTCWKKVRTWSDDVTRGDSQLGAKLQITRLVIKGLIPV